ncbi:MAG TPA: flagellar type III secretion system pore protein FliP [Gemmatimonadaceae bacterium]|nr:flagellar type III secretion system pore protein FliP [Gemmatimonadaceae bacterium]
MTFGSIVGVLLTLGFVLALLGLALKLLKRFAPVASGAGRLRMEIVQRLALGPKQGIAVIRVGERIVAVSVGEGGVNRLFELEPGELREPAPVVRDGSDDADRGARPTSPLDFKAAFKGALKTAGLAIVLALASLPAARAAHAQATNAATAAAKSAQAPAAMVQKLTGAAATAGPAGIPNLDLRVGNGDGLHLSGTVGVVVMMGMLTLLPTLLLMMTGFTRILIVLNFLRQALGTQSAPPTQLVAALALLLTGFVMAPTLSEFNRTALTPWMNGQIDQSQMMQVGAKPFRAFMLRQTRRTDLETFVRIGGGPQPATVDDVPLVTLTSAFVISELRTAFQIGFALFLPFIVIDVAVSSVLMSMGMFMLPPAMISLPFKLLLFVLVDGWSLIVQSLVTSFK